MKKIPFIGRRKKKVQQPERERLHDGPVVIQDDHVSPEYCQDELHGIWDRRNKQCIVHERELPDGTKQIGASNVKIIRSKRRDDVEEAFRDSNVD